MWIVKRTLKYNDKYNYFTHDKSHNKNMSHV